MAMPGRLLQAIARFRRDARGVAAVEFALVLPIMLLLYVGTSEAGLLISMDRRVQTIAGTMGDLVSRANKDIPACDIKDFFAASAGIMAPYSATTLNQVVTAVSVKADGTATVTWSKATPGGVAKVQNTVYPLPKEMSDIAKNSTVIVAEASYSYTPITNLIYKQDILLRRENFFLPRFGGTIVINPTTETGC